jgi:hypothetical protein
MRARDYALRDMIKTGLFLLLACALPCVCASAEAPSVSQSCTVFLGDDEERVLVGNNEDYGDPFANVWFLPAEDAKLGRFLIGTEGVIQGGMNEAGLMFDGLTMPTVEVPIDDRPFYYGMWTARALEVCSTVDEVLAFWQSFCTPGVWEGKAFYADATGDAVLIEGDAIVRKSDPFLVSTNFLQSRTAPDDVTCERFLTATDMLTAASDYTPELFRDILDAVHAEFRGGGGTIYSTVYDLRALTITCYLYYDFAHPIVLDLLEELGRGKRGVDLRSLFGENEAYDAWRAAQSDLVWREIRSMRDDRVTAPALEDYVGHYALEAGQDPLLSSPLVIESVSLTCEEGRLGLVACPEGLSLELIPIGEDRFRCVTLNNIPNLEVLFRRDESGLVSGATFTVGSIAASLERASETPGFAALPGFMIPLPEANVPLAPTGPHLSPGFWIGAAIAVLGLVGCILLLRP